MNFEGWSDGAAHPDSRDALARLDALSTTPHRPPPPQLHPLIGGAWDCKYADVKTLIDKNPNVTRYAEDILTDLGILLRYGYSVQKNFSHGVLGPGMTGWGSEWGDIRCPHDCDTPMFYNITAQRRELGEEASQSAEYTSVAEVADMTDGAKHPFLCTCTIDKIRIPLDEHKELSFEYAVHVLDANKLLNKVRVGLTPRKNIYTHPRGDVMGQS